MLFSTSIARNLGTVQLNKSPVLLFILRQIKKSPDPNPSLPPVNEDEIIENYLKGSGPGGQNVNKKVNCCQLIHKPTGLVVASHHTRSLEQNRKIARVLLQQKLDVHFNGQRSFVNQDKREKALEKLEKRRRATANLLQKIEFKKREGLE
jgi:protein subunit release factor B